MAEDLKELCGWCRKDVGTPYFSTLIKSFCSLKCANCYLESEFGIGQGIPLLPEKSLRLE